MTRFDGAKIALLQDGRVLTLLRDDRPDIPFPAHWDLPGGGREGAEGPLACALRELDEEMGLRLAPRRVLWGRAFRRDDGRITHFFAGAITRTEIAAIRFGGEGQGWSMMPVAHFLRHPRAVPHLRRRLGRYPGATRQPAIRAAIRAMAR